MSSTIAPNEAAEISAARGWRRTGMTMLYPLIEGESRSDRAKRLQMRRDAQRTERARAQREAMPQEPSTEPGRSDWLHVRAYCLNRFGAKDSSGARRVKNRRTGEAARKLCETMIAAVK